MVDTFSWGGGGKRGRIRPVTARRARRPLPVKRVVFGLLSVLVAGAFGTGAYVLYSLRGTGDVLAAMAPADSDVYVTAYLDPALRQKLNLQGLLGRFPGLQGSGGLDAKLDTIMEDAFRSAQVPVSFREDVRPWLGSQIALTYRLDLVATGAILVASKDDEAARAAISKLRSADTDHSWWDVRYEGVTIAVGMPDRGGDEPAVLAVLDGVVVMASDVDTARSVIDVSQGREPSLASSEEFRRTIAGLPDERLGLVYVSLPAVLGRLERTIATQAGAAGEGLSIPPAALQAYRGAGLAVSAQPQGFAFDINVDVDPATLSERQRAALVASGDPSKVLRAIPEDAYGFVAAAGTGPKSWLAPGALTDPNLSAVDQAAGITEGLRDLDGTTAIEVGPGRGGYPAGALLMGTTNDQAIAELMSRLQALVDQGLTTRGAEAAGVRWQSNRYRSVRITTLRTRELHGSGIAPSYAIDSGLLVIGSSPNEVKRVLDAHRGAANLIQTSRFRGARGQIGPSPVLGYADLESVIEAFREAMPEKDRARFDASIAPSLAPLKALIVGQSPRGGGLSGRLFLLVQ